MLSGGRGSRLGGADKSALTVGGCTLLEHALRAVAGADEVVVVGDRPPEPSERAVVYVRERPTYAGPAAALLTGVDALTVDHALVLVLAVDMPMVTVATAERLRGAATGREGAVLVDEAGRRQLALALNREALAAITPARADWEGMAIWRLLRGIDLVEVPAESAEARDIDTAADLADLRAEADPG